MAWPDATEDRVDAKAAHHFADAVAVQFAPKGATLPYVGMGEPGRPALACPLNVPLFGMSEHDLIDGAKLAEPARYYKEVVMRADMNLTF